MGVPKGTPIVRYSDKFKIHCVKLYRELKSSPKVQKHLAMEIENGKWASANGHVPTPKQILEWESKIQVDDKDEIDPVKAADAEIISLGNAILSKARKELKRLRFQSVAEVVGAMKVVDVQRRGYLTKYRNDKDVQNEVTRNDEKIHEGLRRQRRQTKEIQEDIRSAAMAFIDDGGQAVGSDNIIPIRRKRGA